MTNMEKNEVICISSDDDEGVSQNESNEKQAFVTQQSENNCGSHVKMEILPDVNERIGICGQKRRASQMSNDDGTDLKNSTKVFLCEGGSSVEAQSSEKNSDKSINVQETKEETPILKPKLIVKERKTFSPVEQDIFPMFISLCLQKDRSEDMKIIINKLKRRYEQLDPAYANSDAFINFLNEKRNDIMSSRNKLYIYIAEVMNEMKNSCNGKSTLLLNGKNYTSSVNKLINSNPNVPSMLCSNSASTNNSVIGNIHMSKASGTNEDEEKCDATQKKINTILKTMKKCEKYIKKLEESEINFDDENNSSYIKLEKYKYRMVELYTKYCEYTGENADAGRQYLRPKHFSTTGIVAVDHAITSFINSKISKRIKLKKVGAFADALIFPDYRDILECVAKCNELHNLGLNNKKQQQIAKKAFTELGEYLQRSRHNDYWDTFSLFLENREDDPALKDPELAEILMRNKKEGEKRLANVFKEYTKKQEEMKDQITDSKTSSENEEDEEDNIENDVEDNNNEDDIDEDDDINEDDTSLSTDKDKTSTDEDEISIDGDEFAKNKIDTNDTVNVDGTDFDIIEIDGKCQTDANNRLKDTDDDNLKSKNVDNVANIPSCKSNSELEPMKKNDATPSSNTSPNVILSTKADNKISIDRAKENEPNITTEESTDNKPLEEEKPLLRVRSFAKPPTTWEDVYEKVDISSADKSTSKTLINKGIIDLTKETPNQNSTVTKCTTIQIGSKVLPLVKGKYKTLVIPAGKSIIKVKNITNNYVRLNSQDLDSSNAAKLQNGQAVTTLHKVVGISKGSTIVHLPSNQSSNQQMNISNQAKDLQLKQYKPIVRIPQSNRTILLTTKQKGSTLQSSTTNSSTSKSI